ncbi:MAG: hypothetical protein GTO02_00655 [Candidatus Dadabacteria bacterium]|nr:hypothetical protein [Candidatus Dadabacteria bacterium]
MRFFISPDIKRNDLLKLIIIFTTIFFLFLWLTNLLLFLKIGFNIEGIVEYYRGSEESFRPAKSYLGLLEEAHFHFFSMAIILITLTHLILFTDIRVIIKYLVIISSYTSAFFDIISGWLIRFVAPEFAYLKLISFVVLQLSILYLIVVVTLYLYKKNKTLKYNNVS